MKTGHLQLIENQDRRFGSATEYLFTTLKGEDGETISLMFTEGELQTAYRRAVSNIEDIPTGNNCDKLRMMIHRITKLFN